ncbi:hypothetical protein PGT21_017614 [Puccinia graminis f. sp. tritici]|uniref:HAT C-terminal dimerisation domain-containing protein n=1 Tax=Puccinia graminis f. sp. tritici TaxID=56615 RepID=A0A5B0NTS3_PUCGR|nr:hypothetical protein PGT21_017614 [Puccinia graminis f. sp. tritici]KAA1092056.1 hypothetical protein PGTUg99_009093 [Puccinia graminis f. sp. tritici]
MEGDGPKLPMVIYEYIRVLDLLEKKKASARATSLEPMFDPMIKITKKYMDLALSCDTVIIATFLHPAGRMMLFAKRFESHLARITCLIADKFSAREELLKSLTPEPSPPKLSSSASGIHVNLTTDSESEEDGFNFYPTNSESINTNTELDRYNNGDFPLEKKGCHLTWWKAHAKDFPVMGSLARDYLACPASSASVERTFSAAASICASGRSGLAIRTIERSISSHMWLQNRVKLEGMFSDCQAVIDTAEANPKFSKYKSQHLNKAHATKK